MVAKQLESAGGRVGASIHAFRIGAWALGEPEDVVRLVGNLDLEHVVERADRSRHVRQRRAEGVERSAHDERRHAAGDRSIGARFRGRDRPGIAWGQQGARGEQVGISLPAVDRRLEARPIDPPCQIPAHDRVQRAEVRPFAHGKQAETVPDVGLKAGDCTSGDVERPGEHAVHRLGHLGRARSARTPDVSPEPSQQGGAVDDDGGGVTELDRRHRAGDLDRDRGGVEAGHRVSDGRFEVG